MELNFDYNKYSIFENEDEILTDLSKNDCFIHTIKNNYKGFGFVGDNNKCLLFNSNKLDKNINSYIDTNKYDNIKSFIKNKSSIDIDDINDQKNNYSYYKKINNKDFLFQNMIKDINVKDENECLSECLKNENKNCKSVIYLDESKKCIFSKNINIKKNIDPSFNVYTIKKNYDKKNNIDNNYNNMDISANWTKIRDNTVLYNCNGTNSTNPFCTQPFNPDNIENNEIPYYTKCNKLNKYNDIKEQKRYYNKLCKIEYGDQYSFDDDYLNLDSVMECKNNGEEKIRCKLNMYGDNLILEDFSNLNSNFNYDFNNNKNTLLILIFIILLLLILFLLKK
jgi:hypothetical protein